MTDLPWHCVCVGSLDRDPAFAEDLAPPRAGRGLADRVRFTGPRTGADLDGSYAAADLLVLASRAETYGMVVTEALARGLPVVATDVGGRAARRSVTAPTGPAGAAGPARRPRGARAPRCAPGSATPTSEGGCAGQPASGASRSPGWSTTTSVLAGVLAGAAR